MINSLKKFPAILRPMEKNGQMLKYSQGLLHLFERQTSSQGGNFSLPAFTPILKTLIREIWTAYSFFRFSIAFALAAMPENTFCCFQRLSNSHTEKRRQQTEGLEAILTKITFYPNRPLTTPSAIKSIPNNLASFMAFRAPLYLRKVVTFSLISIILDRKAEVIYHITCCEEALENTLLRISLSNLKCFSRACFV